MAAEGTGWDSAGPQSLESRFFVDDGLWRDAPVLTGTTSFEPLPDVQNILVTGGEGFIASWIVRHLVTKYPNAYNVVSFDKLDYCSSLNNARMMESRPNFNFFHGDLTHPTDVLKCLRKYNVDTIFHLAAQTHVDLSFGNSYQFTKNNMLGTHVLLESAVAVGIKRFYHVSTDEVYGEVEHDAADLKEHSLLAPTNPYAASKAAAEMLVTAYVRSFNLPAVVIRMNNVYGPHQYPEKIIPKFTLFLQRKLPLLLHGDGQHTRRYLYAGDAADAFDTILHRGEIGQIYNVDSRDEMSNIDLAKKLLAKFGIDDTASWIQHTRDRPFNDRRYAVDGSKLRQLGWVQRTKFEDGLAATIEWYAKFSSWWSGIDHQALLTAFPTVQNDRVAPGAAAPAHSDSIEIEPPTLGGADSECRDGGAVKGKVMSNGHHTSDGLQAGAKKRKAEHIA